MPVFWGRAENGGTPLMTPEFIDRRRLKAELPETVRTAQVRPGAMTAMYLGICTVLNMIDVLTGGAGI